MFISWLATFLNIVGVSIPQWRKRKYAATDFGGRRQVGLLEYPSEVCTFSYQCIPINHHFDIFKYQMKIDHIICYILVSRRAFVLVGCLGVACNFLHEYCLHPSLSKSVYGKR